MMSEQSCVSPAIPTAVLRASHWLAVFCTASIWLLPPAVALHWAVADPQTLAVQARIAPHAVHGDLASWQRALGALVVEWSLAMVLRGLWHARRCFRQFASGQVFTRAAVDCLRRFAGWVAAAAITGILAASLLSVVLTLQNPPGSRYLAVGIGTDQLFMAFFAGLVWLMASVIGHGQALAEENAAFV